MNDNIAREITLAVLGVLKPATDQSNDKMTTVNFQPTDKYADSFIRSFRKGTGLLGFGKPSAGSSIKSLDIAITLKPGIIADEWVGYTIDIDSLETNPKVTLFREWPEKGGQVEPDPSKLQELLPHIRELMASPLVPANTEPPRQSPETMY